MKLRLFLAGAMKAGTSTLFEYLRLHPDIYMSPIKEPNYYVNKNHPLISDYEKDIDVDQYISKKLGESLHFAVVKKKRDYEMLFSKADNEEYLGEASTSYFHCTESPKMIYNEHNEARIVIILRNPIQRALSHYNMDLAIGRTKQDFNEIIDVEINHYHKYGFAKEGYIKYSLYGQNLCNYISVFDRKNVHVIIFENLISQLGKELETLYRFLNIEKLDATNLVHKNPSVTPKFKTVNYFLNKFNIKNAIRNAVPSNIIQRAKTIYYNDGKKIGISDHQKDALSDIFLEDINRVSSILDYDLQLWKRN